jgi:tetratricopeptide (TPR) repeat protein
MTLAAESLAFLFVSAQFLFTASQACTAGKYPLPPDATCINCAVFTGGGQSCALSSRELASGNRTCDRVYRMCVRLRPFDIEARMGLAEQLVAAGDTASAVHVLNGVKDAAALDAHNSLGVTIDQSQAMRQGRDGLAEERGRDGLAEHVLGIEGEPDWQSMTWQQVEALGPVLLALVVMTATATATATMVLWWRMPLRRATEADAAQGIDKPAITAAPEPSTVAARSIVNRGSTKPKTAAAADECDTPVVNLLLFNVSVPSDGLQGRSRLGKLMHKWLDDDDEAGQRLKYVLWGPGGVGKSTLALKFAARQAERGGGWLRLVFRLSASTMEQDYVGLLDAMLGKSAGRAPSCEEVRGRVHELLQSPAWSRAWLAVLDDLPAPAENELERAGLGWLMGEFPWSHGRTIITTRSAEWVLQREDSREVSATDLQHCDWCGAGSLTMLKCGACRLVYYCSIDCQKAARSKHKVVCVPKRNMEDVMGLSVGSFAEDEACSWIKSTVRQWRNDHAGVLALVRYLGCLPLALGLASAHAGVHGTASPAEFLAALKRVAPPPQEQLEVGAKVELHSLNATELNGKHGELLEYDAEAQRWAVELSEGGSIRVRAPNLALLNRDDCPLSLHAVVLLSRGKIKESRDGEAADSALRKMALLDTTAIPLDLMSRTEKKGVLGLKQHALVTVNDKDLVVIHSLTQLAVRAQTDKGDRRAIAAGVVRALKERLAKFHHHKPSTFFIGRRYAAHARAAAANAAAWGLIPGFPALASPGAAHRGVGRGAGGLGEAQGGRSLLVDVRGMCRSAGVFFQEVGGQYQQALGMYEFTLVCAVALEGHDSSLVAGSWNNIGEVLRHIGKYDEALEMHAKSLGIRTRIYGGDSHPLVADSFNNLGVVYEEKRDLEFALVQHKKALEIRTRAFGTEHPSVAASFNNIANIYEKQGKYEEALELHTKSLEIKTRIYGGDSHPLVADSLKNIGVVYAKKGNRAAATEMYTKAYHIYLKILGPGHPSTQSLAPVLFLLEEIKDILT